MTPSRRDALRIALIYAAFAAIWILFSDIAAEALAPDRAWLTRLSMYKGWLFVGVTALLLYALIRSTLARVEAAEAERVRLYSELAAQLRTFDTVLSACPDLFFLFDADGKLVYRGQLDGSRPGNDVPVTGEDLRRAIWALAHDAPVPETQLPSLGCNIKWRTGQAPEWSGA